MLGEVPSKIAAWVLTTVKGEEAGTDKGLEDPYISLVGDGEQTSAAGRGNSMCRKEDA